MVDIPVGFYLSQSVGFLGSCLCLLIIVHILAVARHTQGGKHPCINTKEIGNV
jgi:hypothetical protein